MDNIIKIILNKLKNKTLKIDKNLSEGKKKLLMLYLYGSKKYKYRYELWSNFEIFENIKKDFKIM